MKGHIYLWQEISSYDKKYLPATRNFFVWQEINAFDKRFLPMTINFFLWKLITCSAKKFLPVTKNISCMLCVIRRISLFDRKYRPLSQICAKTTWNADKISCESEDFVGAWLPGSRLISHPVRDFAWRCRTTLKMVPINFWGKSDSFKKRELFSSSKFDRVRAFFVNLSNFQ